MGSTKQVHIGIAHDEDQLSPLRCVHRNLIHKEDFTTPEEASLKSSYRPTIAGPPPCLPRRATYASGADGYYSMVDRCPHLPSTQPSSGCTGKTSASTRDDLSPFSSCSPASLEVAEFTSRSLQSSHPFPRDVPTCRRQACINSGFPLLPTHLHNNEQLISSSSSSSPSDSHPVPANFGRSVTPKLGIKPSYPKDLERTLRTTMVSQLYT